MRSPSTPRARATPTGGVAAYTWDFGDGTTGSGPAPSHTYAAPGTYPVELGVADCEGKDDTTRRSVVVGATAAATMARADRTPPKLSVKLAGTARRCATARARATVDSPATLKLVVARVVAGRRVPLATVSRRVAKGSAKVAVGMLISGRYTVTVTATDAAGNVSAPRTLKLTVG